MDKIKYYLAIVLALIIGLGIGYFILQKKPDVKIVKEIQVVTRTEYKDRIVNKDTVIERKIYVATNGTVVTEEKEIIKDKIVEKEIIKEKEIVKTETKTINYEWLLSATYTHLNGYPDPMTITISRRIFGSCFIGIGYSVLAEPNAIALSNLKISLENFNISISLLF